MEKRKYLFLYLLLFLLSIASVSASDADDITVQAIDDTLDEGVIVDEVKAQNMAAGGDENNILNESFNNLQSLTDDALGGSELDLQQDYTIADVELDITVLDEVYPQDVEGVVHASRDGEYNLTIV